MSESENRRGLENKKELKNSSPEIIFGIDLKFKESVGSLEEACSTNNLDKIKNLLDSNQFLENIVIRKGTDKEYLKLFERSINSVAQAEVGKDINDLSDAFELERVIKSTKLSPFAVAEFAGALYHLDRDDECENLATMLSESDLGATARANAFNTLGSLYLRQGSAQGSAEAHKKGLAVLSGESNNNLNVQWQTSKLKYGILVSKMTRKVFPDMPEQFFALRREREAMGDTFNLGRTDLDAARAFAALKKQDEAVHYAERAKDLMDNAGYWSGAQQAADLLEQLRRKH